MKKLLPILLLINAFVASAQSSADQEVLPYLFTAPKASFQLYPPSNTADDVSARLSEFNISPAEFLNLAKYNPSGIRITSAGFIERSTISKVNFTLNSMNYTTYSSFLKCTVPQDSVAFLIIPGSGYNMTDYIVSGNVDIAARAVKYGDTYVLVKPNEDFLAIYRGDYKLAYEAMVPIVLNRGYSYSAYYLTQAIALAKYLKNSYKKLVILGVSQGGYATLVVSLATKPYGAIVSSGYSILYDKISLAGMNQIMIPGIDTVFNSAKIYNKLKNTDTKYLFTYGFSDIDFYQAEARNQLTCNLFSTLSNVTCSGEAVGHDFPEPRVENYMRELLSPAVNLNIQGQVSINSGDSVKLYLLRKTPGALYKWYKNDSLIAGQNSDTLLIKTPGVYRAVASTQSGITASSPSVNVFYSGCSASIASEPSNLSICDKSSATISLLASNASSYQWQQSTDGGTSWTDIVNGGIFSNGATASLSISSVSPDMSSYQYMCKVSGLCGTPAISNAMTLTVKPLPVTNAGPDVSLCLGYRKLLSASGAASYLWSNGATTTTQFVVPTTTSTYTLTGTLNGCKQSDTVVVTVNQPPVVGIASNPDVNSTCENSNYTLTADGGVSYLWSTGETTASIGVTGSNIYQVTVTDTKGCKASTNKSIKVFNAPSVKILATPASGVICPGGAVTLETGDGTAYLWNTGSTGSSIRAFTSGLYTVTVTNSNGCTSVFTQPVTLNSDSIILSPSNGISCDGAPITLSASGNGTYRWSTGENTASINVLSSNTYTVSITNTYGCMSVLSKTVIISSRPSAPIITSPSNGTICQGNPVTLQVDGGGSFLWSTGSNSASIQTVTGGIYNVTVTNANGCTGSVSKTVNAYSDSIVTNPSTGEACEGRTIQLSASGSGTYNWNTGESTASISAQTQGIYTVTITNGNGCTNVLSKTITIYKKPFAPVVATPSHATFCPGGSVMLQASDGASYLWSNGAITASIQTSRTRIYSVTVTNSNGCTSSFTQQVKASADSMTSSPASALGCEGAGVTLSASGNGIYKWNTGETTSSIKALGTNTYAVSITNMYGCSSVFSKYVKIYNRPSTAILASPSNATVCQGTSVSLQTGGGGSYLWSTGAMSSSIKASATGTYTVTVTNVNGCTNTFVQQVTVNSPPVAGIRALPGTSIENGQSVTLQAKGVSLYTWNTGATDQSISVSTPGTYYVTVSGTSGCSVASSIVITQAAPQIRGTTNLTPEKRELEITLSPNPFYSSFNLTYSLAARERVDIILYNELGENISLVRNEFQEQGSHSMNIGNDIAVGVYILEVKVGNTVKRSKLIKQR